MHGFQHEWQITRIVKRVSARYHRALWLAVRETVSSDDAVEEELEELRKVLSDSRAKRRPERGRPMPNPLS
jgi:hypothetical protein